MYQSLGHKVVTVMAGYICHFLFCVFFFKPTVRLTSCIVRVNRGDNSDERVKNCCVVATWAYSKPKIISPEQYPE